MAPKGQKPNFMTAEQGIRKVQEGFFAFHVELHTGYNLISNIFQEGEKCGLKEIDYENFFEPYIGIKKRSPYKEIMKIGYVLKLTPFVAKFRFLSRDSCEFEGLKESPCINVLHMH